MSSLKKMTMFGFLECWAEAEDAGLAETAGDDADAATAAGSAAETIPVAAPSRKRRERRRELFIDVRVKWEPARARL